MHKVKHVQCLKCGDVQHPKLMCGHLCTACFEECIDDGSWMDAVSEALDIEGERQFEELKQVAHNQLADKVTKAKNALKRSGLTRDDKDMLAGMGIDRVGDEP